MNPNGVLRSWFKIGDFWRKIPLDSFDSRVERDENSGINVLDIAYILTGVNTGFGLFPDSLPTFLLCVSLVAGIHGPHSLLGNIPVFMAILNCLPESPFADFNMASWQALKDLRKCLGLTELDESLEMRSSGLADLTAVGDVDGVGHRSESGFFSGDRVILGKDIRS